MPISPDWQHGNIRLYRGDCRDVLPHLEGVEAVITDPPYGVGFKYKEYEDTPELFDSVVLPAIKTCIEIASKVVICCMSTKRLFDMPRPKGFVFWAHPGSTRRNTFGGFSECEPILVYGQWKLPNDYKYLPDCTSHTKDKINHPCPKPEKLMSWLIKGSGCNTVCDPFMGSGTTGVALINMGGDRSFIGIEKDPDYFAAAVQRIERHVAQGRLF